MHDDIVVMQSTLLQRTHKFVNTHATINHRSITYYLMSYVIIKQ